MPSQKSAVVKESSKHSECDEVPHESRNRSDFDFIELMPPPPEGRAEVDGASSAMERSSTTSHSEQHYSCAGLVPKVPAPLE